MQVQINGREHQLPADTVVPRSAWSTHTLEAGDAIEIVTAAQGG